MNASIEAARAGEAGKGFAIVAGEIKELALQTAKATNDISTRIVGVQTTSRDSEHAIASIVQIIHEINTIVTSLAATIEEQAVTTGEISTKVHHTADGVQKVNDDMAQISIGVSDVDNDIDQVNQAVLEVKNNCHKVETSVRNLSELSKSLADMMGRFTIR